MKKNFLLAQDEIHTVIEFLQKILENRDVVVLLQGDLASGKTTLVSNYVKSLGHLDQVTSPTFSIQSVYSGDIYHYDVYNKTLEEFISLGLLEEFDKSGVHFVEWGDEKLQQILNNYGIDIVVVKIIKANNKREYIVETQD